MLDQVMAKIGKRLHLSKETEYEVLAEVRTHLEDAIADAAAEGGDEQLALLKAAERFGIDEASAELQEVHANRESIDAITAVVLPVLFALVLRWLAFAPGGSALDWRQLLARPGFCIVAVAVLIIPIAFFYRRRFILAVWGVFWLLTVIFVIFPSIIQW